MRYYLLQYLLRAHFAFTYIENGPKRVAIVDSGFVRDDAHFSVFGPSV